MKWFRGVALASCAASFLTSCAVQGQPFERLPSARTMRLSMYIGLTTMPARCYDLPLLTAMKPRASVPAGMTLLSYLLDTLPVT